MKNETPTLKFSRQMTILIVFLALIGFLGGVLVALLPCQRCEKVVLTLGERRIFGEHRLYSGGWGHPNFDDIHQADSRGKNIPWEQVLSVDARGKLAATWAQMKKYY